MVTPDSFDRTPKQTSKEIFEQVMAMRDQAVSLDNQGEHTEALEILILAEKKCRQNRHMDALLTILRQKAILLSADGNHITALQVIEEAEQICNALLDWESLFSRLQSKSVFEMFASRPSQGGSFICQGVPGSLTWDPGANPAESNPDFREKPKEKIL